MRTIEINLQSGNIKIPNEIKMQISRASTSREFRKGLVKGAKSVVSQLPKYGSWIPPIKPIFPMLQTSLEGAGMGAEAAELAEVTVIAEETAVVGETLTLSAEAAEILTVAEVVEGGTVAVGGGAAAGGPGGAVVVVVVVVVILIVVWAMTRSSVSPNKRNLFDNEFRKLHRQFMDLYKKRSR